jgi:hypothetical protein
MKPELMPGSGVRNGGSPKFSVGSTSVAMRRSLIAPISDNASAIWSAANATGSAWKFPPETISPVSTSTSGLSVTALASIVNVRADCVSRSSTAPATCGWQRRQ